VNGTCPPSTWITATPTAYRTVLDQVADSDRPSIFRGTAPFRLKSQNEGREHDRVGLSDASLTHD